MPPWFSESQRIQDDIARTTIQNPAKLQTAGLIVASDDAKRLLDRIDRYREWLQTTGRIGRTVATVNDGLTVIAGGVWVASLLGVAVFPPLVVASVIATPAGATYAVADRVRQHVRRRRLDALEGWYRAVEAHVDAIDAEVKRRLRDSSRSAPS